MAWLEEQLDGWGRGEFGGAALPAALRSELNFHPGIYMGSLNNSNKVRAMKLSMLVRWGALALAMLAFEAEAVAPETGPYQASMDADGVQRVALNGGSYFFRPDRIVVQAGQPLEISVKVEPGVVPHSFVLEAADGKVLADVKLGEAAQTLQFNLPPGNYVFYCPKRLLGFKSHRERGMAGVLEARE